jgi:DNA-binding response OmpR family regulator
LLVVIGEKDPHELETLRNAFEAPDCEVLAAYDGTVVLGLARERSPDAVVVNSSLGQMGGLAVSREIKTLAHGGELREPKIVVLLEREADTWLAAWSQCDLYRTKPVDALEISELVRTLVSQTEDERVP